MPIVTSEDLATYMGIDHGTYETQIDRALDAAELTIAAELGALTLVDAETTQNWEIKTSRNVIEIKNGILRSVEALSIDGRAVDLADLQQSYWTINYSEGFARGGLVVCTYKHGFENAGQMPARLKEAILQTAEWMFKGAHKGREKTSEKLSDYAVSYSSKEGVSVPHVAKLLIAEFARAPV